MFVHVFGRTVYSKMYKPDSSLWHSQMPTAESRINTLPSLVVFRLLLHCLYFLLQQRCMSIVTYSITLLTVTFFFYNSTAIVGLALLTVDVSTSHAMTHTR